MSGEDTDEPIVPVPTALTGKQNEQLKVAVVIGSNRRESINRRLAEALVRLVGNRMEAQFIRIDDLPMYNPDLEWDRPATVNRFTQEIASADALLVVMPEHNRSIPAVLKNAIDWGSKPMDRNVWKGKVAAITGTSPGQSERLSASSICARSSASSAAWW